MLEVDGVKLGQTLAICRYIASISPGFPGDPLQVRPAPRLPLTRGVSTPDSCPHTQAALADSAACCMEEPSMQANVYPTMIIKEGDEFKAGKAKYDDDLPRHLTNLTKVLGDRSFFHGDEPGYADFMAWGVFEIAARMSPAQFEGFPEIAAWYDRVCALPVVQSYVRDPARDVSEWL